MSSYGPEESPPACPIEPDIPAQHGPAEPERIAPAPSFSVAGTIICTVLTVLLVSLLLVPTTRLGFLEHPGDDLARLVAREMDAREALQGAPRWEQAVDRFLSGNEDPLEQSIRWYEELPRELERPRDELYRIILLAEAGRADRISAAIVPWQYQGEIMERMLDWVRAAYLGAPPTLSAGQHIVAEIRDELSEDWFADILVARIAAGIGDRQIENTAKSAIAMRGHVLLGRRRALVIVQLVGLVMAGLFLVRLLFRKMSWPLGTAVLPPPWNAEDGYALFIRGALAFLVISILAVRLLPDASAVTAIISLLAGMPLVGLLIWYLRRKGLSPSQVLGLCVPSGGRRLAQVTVVLIGAAIAGELMIAGIVAVLHIKMDWTDGFLEDLLWKPWWAVYSIALDTIVWAPIVEEIAFRGVLYGSLRTKLGIAPAVLLSSGAFALVHGYEAIGSASVLWSGIVWALAYERTRSLWPGILAHSVNNLVVTVEFILLYR